MKIPDGSENIQSSECPHCGQEWKRLACSVSVNGMYDMYLFHKVEGGSVDELIRNWQEHNASPNPAIVGGRKVDDLGPSCLCPAIVKDENRKVIRRVGPMVMKNERELEQYREAMLNDPDIPRLLAESK